MVRALLLVPLVEPSPSGGGYSLVTFVWRGTPTTNNVVIVDGVAAGVGGIDPVNSRLQPLPGTDVWYRTYEIRNDARFTYKLSENDSMVPFTAPGRRSMAVRDPLNPRTSAGFSYVELPGAPPLLGERDGTPLVGSVETTRFVSGRTGNQHTAWELSCSSGFGDTLAEIVPRVREAYHAGTTAGDTAVAGSSLGGLTRQVRQSSSLPVRFYLEAGAMEIPEQLETNRRFRDAVRSTGARLVYREFNGNHHYLPWRPGFADGLVSLFGGS